MTSLFLLLDETGIRSFEAFNAVMKQGNIELEELLLMEPAVVSTFKKFAEEANKAGKKSKRTSIWSTHPSTESRVKALLNK